MTFICLSVCPDVLKFSNFQVTSWLSQRRYKDRENKRLSGSSRRSETPESPSEVPSPDDVIDVSNNQKKEEIVDAIVASSAPEMDTLQIINKTLEYFGHDYFGNEPNRSTKVSHRKKVVLRVLYNSLLKIPAGPFVNGFNLSYLAGKMMERRDNKNFNIVKGKIEDQTEANGMINGKSDPATPQKSYIELQKFDPNREFPEA
ncbi:hypothetical protein L5515_012423 [Caenorhabditis briggsae]|uniref:Uncharacterized protein n=1 Tax=Caenorhabditis briggsae TaxID=6238 RepID=A0AAE9EXG8_CAEBR|nr:hypothetical protein L5515_012423 [Caenorhabditis briggsae]